jgi:protein-disulfide isomerase
MTESSGTVSGGGQPGGPSNIAIYAICVVLGLAAGILGTYVFVGGGVGGNDPVVAEYNGKSVKASEAFAPIKTRLFEVEDELYRTKEQAINDFVEQRLLEAESKKQNLPVEQLVQKETGNAAPADVTDKQVEEFLSSKGLSLTDPRIRVADVKDYLKYRQRFDQRQNYVAKLKSNAKVKILVKEPEAPKIVVATEGYPTWGNPKAPVTIVEFSDFQCPYCGRAEPTLGRIKKEYGPDKVKIVFRDMTLPAHPRAVPAALAAHCANDQGKFWEFHDIAFKNQQKLEDSDLKSYAKEIGVDTGKFNECFEKKTHQDIVEKSRKEAESVGIQATPSFVVNGTLIQGAQPFERFKKEIDRINGRG